MYKKDVEVEQALLLKSGMAYSTAIEDFVSGSQCYFSSWLDEKKMTELRKITTTRILTQTMNWKMNLTLMIRKNMRMIFQNKVNFLMNHLPYGLF